LKKLREEQGFSRESFADHCGLHRTYISGIERGVRNPTVMILRSNSEGAESACGSAARRYEGCVQEPLKSPAGDRCLKDRSGSISKDQVVAFLVLSKL
jgi:transcriptional regulator with XRE-family HTH domain